MYRLYLFVCILFICFNSLSQSDYRFKNYTINDGLSQSAATTIIQDDNYSRWIGTQDGINRFDGKNIEVFEASSKKNPGLERQYIICSEKTTDGEKINRYIAGHKLIWHVSNALVFGFGEMIIYTGVNRGLDLTYLNPFVPYFFSALEGDEQSHPYDNANSMNINLSFPMRLKEDSIFNCISSN